MIAASVWIALVITESLPPLSAPWPSEAAVVTGRFRALTMPVVTVSARPSGLPTAITGWPTASLLESPSEAGLRSVGGLVTFRTARSVVASVPTMVAL